MSFLIQWLKSHKIGAAVASLIMVTVGLFAPAASANAATPTVTATSGDIDGNVQLKAAAGEVDLTACQMTLLYPDAHTSILASSKSIAAGESWRWSSESLGRGTYTFTVTCAEAHDSVTFTLGSTEPTTTPEPTPTVDPTPTQSPTATPTASPSPTETTQPPTPPAPKPVPTVKRTSSGQKYANFWVRAPFDARIGYQTYLGHGKWGGVHWVNKARVVKANTSVLVNTPNPRSGHPTKVRIVTNRPGSGGVWRSGTFTNNR